MTATTTLSERMADINSLTIAQRFKLVRTLIESFPDVDGTDYTVELDCALTQIEKAEALFEGRHDPVPALAVKAALNGPIYSAVREAQGRVA